MFFNPKRTGIPTQKCCINDGKYLELNGKVVTPSCPNQIFLAINACQKLWQPSSIMPMFIKALKTATNNKHIKTIRIDMFSLIYFFTVDNI